MSRPAPSAPLPLTYPLRLDHPLWLPAQVVDKTDVSRIFSSAQLNELFRLDKHHYRAEGGVPLTPSASEATMEDAVLQATPRLPLNLWPLHLASIHSSPSPCPCLPPL